MGTPVLGLLTMFWVGRGHGWLLAGTTAEAPKSNIGWVNYRG